METIENPSWGPASCHELRGFGRTDHDPPMRGVWKSRRGRRVLVFGRIGRETLLDGNDRKPKLGPRELPRAKGLWQNRSRSANERSVEVPARPARAGVRQDWTRNPARW